ncbi:MAG: hypothetical protein U1B30_10900 [Pseudomonadota bacterium]|nr:hypothetical protein [Pseudomonadota bacterium]
MKRLPSINRLMIELLSAKRRGVHTPAANQRGGMLIESLVGMLILSIIGGGIMHSTARMTASQRELAVNHIAVNQMRTMLMNRSAGAIDLCEQAPRISLPGEEEPLDVVVSGCATAPANVSGVKIDGVDGPALTIDAFQPLVLELGEGDKLVRVGGVAAND